MRAQGGRTLRRPFASNRDGATHRARPQGNECARLVITIDAIVMTSAWLRGDTIFTSDLPDMIRIKQGFVPSSNLQIERA